MVVAEQHVPANRRVSGVRVNNPTDPRLDGFTIKPFGPVDACLRWIRSAEWGQCHLYTSLRLLVG